MHAARKRDFSVERELEQRKVMGNDHRLAVEPYKSPRNAAGKPDTGCARDRTRTPPAFSAPMTTGA